MRIKQAFAAAIAGAAILAATASPAGAATRRPAHRPAPISAAVRADLEAQLRVDAFTWPKGTQLIRTATGWAMTKGLTDHGGSPYPGPHRIVGGCAPERMTRAHGGMYLEMNRATGVWLATPDTTTGCR